MPSQTDWSRSPATPRPEPSSVPDWSTAGPLDTTGELAAVGVPPQFRRRGVASAVSVHLARAAHDKGVRPVWLEAALDEEQIYTRAGFIIAGQKLWISLR
jgi:predicted acetyltransferase